MQIIDWPSNYIYLLQEATYSNQMSSDDSDDYTKQILDESLNNARINSPASIMSTPSTRRARDKTSVMKSLLRSESGSQDDQQWRILLTRSIKQANQTTPEKKECLTPSLKINIQKTAEIKNKRGCSYQNMCPICLNKYNQTKGSLECLHQFCYSCISQWTKTSTICPCCRRPFTSILKLVGSITTPNIREIERVPVQQKQLVINTQYDYYTCYQCGFGDNQHVLLICDQCDFYCCHVYCDPQLLNEVPEGDWFCIYCRGNRRTEDKEEQQVEVQRKRQRSPNKHVAHVAHRTRSRQNSYNLRSRTRNRLSVLRNFRRRR